MLAIVSACAIIGLDGHIIEVQTDFNPRAGIPSFVIVGLPDFAVKESRERVRASIRNSALQFPNKGYVVNLSPADLPKHSTAYDLAIAVGVLAATDQIPLGAIEKAMFVGELSLDGTIRHVKGIMSTVYTAAQAGYESVFVPADDAPEAGLIQGIKIIPVKTLGQLVEHVYNLNPITPYSIENIIEPESRPLSDGLVDFGDVKGQHHVKRALEIAAAGNHNVRLIGSPGTGKTLLARAMPGILPKLTHEEALEITRIYSVADMLQNDQPLLRNRPFRAPHHTISQAGMVGGGAIPKPGEITLSHRGVLFLDECTEHSIKTLEALRQPIEDKIVTISRAKGTLTFPANFLLVLAHNPCPCGYYGDPIKPCTCTPSMITRYQSRLSGPLLDRIDIHVDVPRVDYDKLLDLKERNSRLSFANGLNKQKVLQRIRFEGHRGLFANSDMRVSEISKFCIVSSEARQLIELSVKRLQLSARSYHRILKLGRTIADLALSELIEVQHIAEAIQYRPQQSQVSGNF